MTKTKSTKGASYNANYHLVWCPKYRRQILTGLVAIRLSELFAEIAKKWDLEIMAHEIMPDHVHLFISAPPKFTRRCDIPPRLKDGGFRPTKLTCKRSIS